MEPVILAAWPSPWKLAVRIMGIGKAILSATAQCSAMRRQEKGRRAGDMSADGGETVQCRVIVHRPL